MRALLDTHAFLWWTTDDPRMPARVREFLGDTVNELLFSAASAWELIIKVQLRKLRLPDAPDEFIQEQLALNAIVALPVHLAHVLHVLDLPMHHRDPFDRLLIAQSRIEHVPIVTADPLIAQYQIETIW